MVSPVNPRVALVVGLPRHRVVLVRLSYLLFFNCFWFAVLFGF